MDHASPLMRQDHEDEHGQEDSERDRSRGT
jgi:hypothetical protein